MFDEEYLLRICRQKSKLMTRLKVEVSARLSTNCTNAIFLDGCAIFWTINWPDEGAVDGYLKNFKDQLL